MYCLTGHGPHIQNSVQGCQLNQTTVFLSLYKNLNYRMQAANISNLALSRMCEILQLEAPLPS